MFLGYPHFRKPPNLLRSFSIIFPFHDFIWGFCHCHGADYQGLKHQRDFTTGSCGDFTNNMVQLAVSETSILQFFWPCIQETLGNDDSKVLFLDFGGPMCTPFFRETKLHSINHTGMIYPPVSAFQIQQMWTWKANILTSWKANSGRVVENHLLGFSLAVLPPGLLGDYDNIL